MHAVAFSGVAQTYMPEVTTLFGRHCGLTSWFVEQRILGRTGRPVSIVGLGTWQLGGDWGEVTEAEALAVLDVAVQSGVTLIDTADVYGDGRSEQRCRPSVPVNGGGLLDHVG